MSTTATIAKWATHADKYLNRVDPQTALTTLSAFAKARNIAATDNTIPEAIDKHTLWEAVKANDPLVAPIRDAFEFDKDVAFEAYGLQRAQKLLSSLRVEVVILSNGQERNVPVKAMVSVQPETSPRPVMVNRNIMLSNPELRQQNVNYMWKRLADWCNEVTHLDEFTTEAVTGFVKEKLGR